jgi:hypothetical protein
MYAHLFISTKNILSHQAYSIYLCDGIQYIIE